MANYYASCRTNYFNVKDVAKFKEEMAAFPVSVHEKNGLVTVLGEDADGGGWPCSVWDEEAQDFVECDFEGVIAEHLTDDSIAVIIEVGAEKLRYLVGWATAINSNGETETISLHDIYAEAEARFGIKPTVAEY